MCMACQEMELYYAYLDAIEEEKRKAQPWQCEVILFPEDGEPVRAEPVAALETADFEIADPETDNPAPRKRAKSKPAMAKPSTFACDTPE